MIRMRALYTRVQANGELMRTGSISEARLRAWEYFPGAAVGQANVAGRADTVRLWQSQRPDLVTIEQLLVGDFEEKVESH